MKAKGFQTLFLVVLVNLNLFGVKSNEINEEAQPNYEYIQIFKSIPALFEYLLDALEERPEILEKSDVTMFKRNLNTDNDEKNIEKRDTEEPNEGNVLNVDKRDAEHATKTTEAHEYGNSNVIMKGLDEIDSNGIAKRMADAKNEPNKDINTLDCTKRSILFKLDDDKNDLLHNYGDMFMGFDHLFGLDLKPEDIEERILAAEKLLEEHNNKKEKK